MNNKKGGILTAALLYMLTYYGLTGTAVVIGAHLTAGGIISVCLWHIPAWEKAKKYGCEKEYQAGNMQCGYQKEAANVGSHT